LYWTPGSLIQAEDRVHRIGQLKNVKIFYFFGINTIDELLWPLVRKKMQLLGEFVEGTTDQDLTASVLTSTTASASGNSASKEKKDTLATDKSLGILESKEIKKLDDESNVEGKSEIKNQPPASSNAAAQNSVIDPVTRQVYNLDDDEDLLQLVDELAEEEIKIISEPDATAEGKSSSSKKRYPSATSSELRNVINLDNDDEDEEETGTNEGNNSNAEDRENDDMDSVEEEFKAFVQTSKSEKTKKEGKKKGKKNDNGSDDDDDDDDDDDEGEEVNDGKDEYEEYLKRPDPPDILALGLMQLIEQEEKKEKEERFRRSSQQFFGNQSHQKQTLNFFSSSSALGFQPQQQQPQQQQQQSQFQGYQNHPSGVTPYVPPHYNVPVNSTSFQSNHQNQPNSQPPQMQRQLSQQSQQAQPSQQSQQHEIIDLVDLDDDLMEALNACSDGEDAGPKPSKVSSNTTFQFTYEQGSNGDKN
jgi:hypothetical protein